MADIELVIKIPQKWFDDMIREEFTDIDELCAVIQHGILLPKHEDLIDKGKFKKWIETQDGDKLMTEYYLDALDMQETIVGGSCDAITNGVQLPEGHGRLSDLDKIWPNF